MLSFRVSIHRRFRAMKNSRGIKFLHWLLQSSVDPFWSLKYRMVRKILFAQFCISISARENQHFPFLLTPNLLFTLKLMSFKVLDLGSFNYLLFLHYSKIYNDTVVIRDGHNVYALLQWYQVCLDWKRIRSRIKSLFIYQNSVDLIYIKCCRSGPGNAIGGPCASKSPHLNANRQIRMSSNLSFVLERGFNRTGLSTASLSM